MFTHSANQRNFFAVIQHVCLQKLLIFKLSATFWDAHEDDVVLLLYVFVIVRVLDLLGTFHAFELQGFEYIQKGSLHFDSFERISALGTRVFFSQPGFDAAGAH
jgi:hypothetical protein